MRKLIRDYYEFPPNLKSRARLFEKDDYTYDEAIALKEFLQEAIAYHTGSAPGPSPQDDDGKRYYGVKADGVIEEGKRHHQWFLPTVEIDVNNLISDIDDWCTANSGTENVLVIDDSMLPPGQGARKESFELFILNSCSDELFKTLYPYYRVLKKNLR